MKNKNLNEYFFNTIKGKLFLYFIIQSFILILLSSLYFIIIKDKWGALIGKEIILRMEIYVFLTDLIILSLLLLLILIFSKKISKPVEKLKESVLNLKEGKFEKAKLNFKRRDEFGDIFKIIDETIDALEKTDEERKQIDKAKTEFLSITSHELRSPMTPMRGQLQMLLGNYFGKLNKEQRDSLEVVLRNTERLDKIIVDFLEVSRIEAARLKFEFVKTDLNIYVRRLVKEMIAFMPEKKIKILMKLHKLPTILVDPDRTMQVLRNLLNNAIKFSKPNSKIEIETRLYRGKILFSVKDYAGGLRKQDQLKIFEPFFQANQTMYDKKKGTGLGLAICKGIVKSQGGKIWLESEYGKGTTFYFTIPLKPVREIKPIKLLFSSEENLERDINTIFREILGPIGQYEFNLLKKEGALTKKDILSYINELSNKGVLDIVRQNLFKSKIILLFGGKIKKIAPSKKIKKWVETF